MATITEMREMGDEQLAATLKEACKTLFEMRVKAQTDRLEVPSELRRNRKLIAQIKTLQSERRISKAAEAAKAPAE
jgi:large subunit ribosomal protein L29